METDVIVEGVRLLELGGNVAIVFLFLKYGAAAMKEQEKAIAEQAKATLKLAEALGNCNNLLLALMGRGGIIPRVGDITATNTDPDVG